MLLVGLFELDPALFAAGLVTRDDSFTERVFDALKIDFNLVTDDERAFAARTGKFTKGDTPLCLQAEIDNGHVFFNGDNAALDDRTFERLIITE